MDSPNTIHDPAEETNGSAGCGGDKVFTSSERPEIPASNMEADGRDGRGRETPHTVRREELEHIIPEATTPLSEILEAGFAGARYASERVRGATLVLISKNAVTRWVNDFLTKASKKSCASPQYR